MAHKMLKPYCFLLYFLSLITFFFIGATYAGIISAGKNQGLAGGAIVVAYGMVSSVIGLLLALFFANFSNRHVILRLNILLTLCCAGFYTYFYFKYKERQIEKKQEDEKKEQPLLQTAPIFMPLSFSSMTNKKTQENTSFSLGMFSPSLSDLKTLYLYNDPNLSKTIMEHSPTDSITFKRTSYSQLDISTAPPYLAPAHLKLDYEILYFKVISVTSDFYEIEVNKYTNQTAFVSKYSGVLQYWPEFLLGINSVEFLNPESQKIYVKPLNHAGIVKQSYSFMKPIKIKQEWMYVLLLNNDFETVGKGWIKWNENGNFLLKYSLLS